MPGLWLVIQFILRRAEPAATADGGREIGLPELLVAQRG
jgi:hypothetical protein